MLKIFQARLQQYVNRELPDVKLVLEKAEAPEIKLPTSVESLKKQESSRKASAAATALSMSPRYFSYRLWDFEHVIISSLLNGG